RLELEDEFLDLLESPEEILWEVLALRDNLIKEMERQSSYPHEKRVPRCVLLPPTTLEEGLAMLQGRKAPEFTRPPLDHYFEAMEELGMENVTPWDGEPENDRDYLQAVDAIIACCRRAAGRKRQR